MLKNMILLFLIFVLIVGERVGDRRGILWCLEIREIIVELLFLLVI